LNSARGERRRGSEAQWASKGRQGNCKGRTTHIVPQVLHGGKALVVTPGVPFDLGIWIVNVLVRQDDCGEGGIGGVCDEPIHTISEIGVGALENVRKVPTLVPLLALVIQLHIPASRAENVLPVCLKGFGA
jgi:hypothetical protein